uniref:Uncharacterized protein n=1 Tax=Cacopsylla melanoneura TaxID=428564 RepID=A0A8D8PT76_9HEMI
MKVRNARIRRPHRSGHKVSYAERGPARHKVAGTARVMIRSNEPGVHLDLCLLILVPTLATLLSTTTARVQIIILGNHIVQIDHGGNVISPRGHSLRACFYF